jgi:hypothetical protein
MSRLGRIPNSQKIVDGEGYCRKCQKTKSLNNFWDTTNPMLDSNGKMSICSSCCNELYDTYFSIHNNVDLAIKLTCRDLDIRYNEEALRQAQSHAESLLSKGKSADKLFGYYKSKLSSTGKANERLEDFRFKDSEFENTISEEISGDFEEDLVLFWGKGFDIDDYNFLESELTRWKQTHKCDNQAEITLLREICIKILAIRKRRENNESASNDLKELQDLMKTASVDPAKANQASAGKSHDAFGVWVKDIEQFRPAEWYDQQEKYVDMDGFKPYLNNYIKRPVENFLTGVRNFFVDDGVDANLEEDSNVNNPGDSNG